MTRTFSSTAISIEVSSHGSTLTLTISPASCSSSPCLSPELERRIKGCDSLRELYLLLFEVDSDSPEVMDAFCRKRLELEGILPPEKGEEGGGQRA